MSNEIKFKGLDNVPSAIIEALTTVHTGLFYKGGTLSGTANVPVGLLDHDIEFTMRNIVPAKNAASRFETYNPRNATQQYLLDRANFFAQASGQFMGLFIAGEPGLGKSHIAISLAKELDSKHPTRYIHAPSNPFDFSNAEPLSGETVIIDGLNDYYGWARGNFAAYLKKMRDNDSGTLIITSSMPLEEKSFESDLLDEASAKVPNIFQIIGRPDALLELVPVTGNPYDLTRQDQETNWIGMP